MGVLLTLPDLYLTTDAPSLARVCGYAVARPFVWWQSAAWSVGDDPPDVPDGYRAIGGWRIVEQLRDRIAAVRPMVEAGEA